MSETSGGLINLRPPHDHGQLNPWLKHQTCFCFPWFSTHLVIPCILDGPLFAQMPSGHGEKRASLFGRLTLKGEPFPPKKNKWKKGGPLNARLGFGFEAIRFPGAGFPGARLLVLHVHAQQVLPPSLLHCKTKDFGLLGFALLRLALREEVSARKRQDPRLGLWGETMNKHRHVCFKHSLFRVLFRFFFFGRGTAKRMWVSQL